MLHLETLEDMIKVQCSHGNWNFDPYMHGMANGLILARAVLTDTEPEFLKAPDQWLIDNPMTIISEPTQVGAAS